jgi:diguanylate cyclase (GGDEF)-like protein
MYDKEKFKSLQDSLMNLTRERSYLDGDESAQLERLLLSCAQILDVSRTSFWVMNSTQQYLDCELLFDTKDTSFHSGERAHRQESPNYFKAIAENRIIDASDARHDPRTSDCVDIYLKPSNIYSILDVPVFLGGQLYGVLSIEQRDIVRKWDIAEFSYATAIADTISLIIERKEWLATKAQLHTLERIDNLTELENRSFFQNRIQQDWNTLLKGETQFQACIALGLDNFVELNDNLGFQAADTVLKELARRYKVLAIKSDIKICRLGGDVFGFWLPKLEKPVDLHKLITLIQTETSKLIHVNEAKLITVNATIGITTLSKLETIEDPILGNSLVQTCDDPIRCSEIALSKAKKTSKGSVSFFRIEWLNELNANKKLEDDIREAFASGQFFAHYQPIVSAGSGQLVGLETLVRWAHPEKGTLYPDDFLTAITQLGLMPKLGSLMLESACKDLNEINQKGFQVDWISVNLSAEQLYNPELVNEIKFLLEQNNLKSSSLELEIVEELISQESTIAQAQIEAISALGIKLAIDDFGTGYSSLSRLKNLPVTKLKIDKAFIDGLPQEDSDQCIARSIIGLAKGLEFDIVAEGVETQAQESWLRKHGCDFLQGFYFAKPMSKTDVLAYAQRNQLAAIKELGHYTISYDQDVFQITPLGQWDEATANKFFEELNGRVAKLNGRPWATIVDTRKWQVATRDVQKIIAIKTRNIVAKNLCYEAFVIPSNDLANYQTEIMTPTNPNYERQTFNDINRAKDWLNHKGFSLKTEARKTHAN